MPSSAQFQLFPPPSPRTRSKRNPFRKEQRKNSASSRGPSPSNDDKHIKPSVKSEAVIVQIIEDTSILAPPPTKAKSQSPEPSVFPQSNNAVSPFDKELPPPPPQHPVMPEDPSTTPGSHGHPLPGPPNSPPPIRSMFPIYNPALPLSKQSYYPQQTSVYNAPREVVSGDQYSPIPSPASNIDNTLGGPKTVPASIVNFPSDVLDPRETEYSSNKELEHLWEATNGQGQTMSLRLFNLKLSKYVFITHFLVFLFVDQSPQDSARNIRLWKPFDPFLYASDFFHKRARNFEVSPS